MVIFVTKVYDVEFSLKLSEANHLIVVKLGIEIPKSGGFGILIEHNFPNHRQRFEFC